MNVKKRLTLFCETINGRYLLLTLLSIRIYSLTDVGTTQAVINNVPGTIDNPESEAKRVDDGIEMSRQLEKEICLAINRELHVSYCYLVMSGIFNKQGLKSFCGMCSRQEDFHRGVARELLHHVTSRGAHLKLADIAEPGPACTSVSCAEAVRSG